MADNYSKTPLAQKLGIKAGFTLLLLNAPENYFRLFETLPENLTLLDQPQTNSADFIHLFITTQEALKKTTITCKDSLKKNGMVWISWPKTSSGWPTDLKRDLIREHLISEGLVDIKVASIDSNWSGLKFVIPVKNR